MTTRSSEPNTGTMLVERARYSISGRKRLPKSALPDAPLVIALPGGTYTSAYFDVPGYSLLERADAIGIPSIAIDRPGYVNSTPLAPAQATITGNAERLDEAIGAIWEDARAGGAPGIVLIGHSIGGAITVEIAARQPAWPLLGIAISGVGLKTPPADAVRFSGLPDIPMIDLPPPVKDQMMFGPGWTFGADMPERSHIADAPVPRAELIDITGGWQTRVRTETARVTVPVHYRQAEFDRLWIVDEEQVGGFGDAFSNSPNVDARIFQSAGHCIDFHRLGAAFHLDQLAFALRCAVRRTV
jgi:pimeloyl-ACP methyl ester carboxylesterase